MPSFRDSIPGYGPNTGQPSDPRNNNPAYRARQAARNQRINDPFRYVPDAQKFAEEGVKSYGALIQPELMGAIGDTLGGLNSIGALRSGGTQVALNDLTRTYADRIGTFAKSATLDAIGTGLNASDVLNRRKESGQNVRNARVARQGDVMRGIAGVVGSGIGFLASGGVG